MDGLLGNKDVKVTFPISFKGSFISLSSSSSESLKFCRLRLQLRPDELLVIGRISGLWNDNRLATAEGAAERR